MSQIGQYIAGSPFIVPIGFLEGNTGGQVPPDATQTIYLLGSGNINVAGNPGTSTLTFTVVGTTDHAVQIGNASGSLTSIGVGTNGQVLIGATAADPAFSTITSSNNSILFTPGPHTLDMVVASSGSISTITGNTGGPISPTAGNINIVTANSNIIFAGASSTETLDFGLTTNLLLGSDGAITSGTHNVSVGKLSLASDTSGANNTALGYSSLENITTGSNNISLGSGAGANLTLASSNNILIGSAGVLADSATIRIGTSGTQTTAFIVGIDGVNVGSVAKVVTLASDQLGTAIITAGAGITVTPSANAITIATSGITSVSYTNVNTSPYVVLSTDEYLSVDSSGAPITIELPNAATLSRLFVIKDRTGSAATNHITVTTVGGAVNIDGATTFVMNTAYQSIQLIGNGSTYEIY